MPVSVHGIEMQYGTASVFGSVVEPDSVNLDPNTEPDPAFSSESGYGSRVLMTKN
jgi:hypothetical protein